MALVFYNKKTGLVMRIVMDAVHTDDQLELVHFPGPDEAFARVETRLETFDLRATQQHVNRITGLDPK